MRGDRGSKARDLVTGTGVWPYFEVVVIPPGPQRGAAEVPVSKRLNTIARVVRSTLSGLHEALVAWLLAVIMFGTLILIPPRELSPVAHDHARIEPRATMHINPATSARP